MELNTIINTAKQQEAPNMRDEHMQELEPNLSKRKIEDVLPRGGLLPARSRSGEVRTG
jgi:hypothetical protein